MATKNQKDKCLVRLNTMLSNSSVEFADHIEIMDTIQKAKAELKLQKMDDIEVDEVAQEAQAQILLQRKINKRNAIENEIKGRKLVDYVLREFPENPQEGLIAILVGSNRQKIGARASVAVQQHSAVNNAINGFQLLLEKNGVSEFFHTADDGVQKRIAKVLQELGEQPEAELNKPKAKVVLTEKNKKIVKVGTLMHENSESMRLNLNDRGANIGKIWGYIVRQSHDPHRVRNAADILKDTETTYDEKLEGAMPWNKNYNRNFNAWKKYVMPLLDEEKTFANVNDIDQFMVYAYSSLVKNQNLKSDGADFAFNAKSSKDMSKSSQMKRVLHFKNSDSWFDYNSKFGMGSLSESYYAGLTSAGRNIGIMDTLGTKPEDTYKKIVKAVGNRIATDLGDPGRISEDSLQKFLDVVTGRVYETGSYTAAKYSAILRSIASMAKLGGATIAAVADIAQYAGEMRYQGRSFFGSMAEATGSLLRRKNTKEKKNIAKVIGVMFDNSTYDTAGRFQVGDNMPRKWTNAQRTFFKYNLLSWWTNNLKESAVLGMANNIAQNKNLTFDKLDPGLRTLFKQYDINSTTWNIIRRTAMKKADDGTEFLDLSTLDNISDIEAKLISGLDNPSARELRNIKDSFRTSVSGMLLDRATYAVIEPDARVKAELTRSSIAGTFMGEAIRFIAQFKAFPVSIIMKTLGREKSFIHAGQTARGLEGMASLIAASTIMGYVAMTAKDILKGREPRTLDLVNNPEQFFKTFLAAFVQGGGLGIYADVLFQQTRSGLEKAGALLGPVPLSAFDYLQVITELSSGNVDAAKRIGYRTTLGNIPFLNIFYAKAAFDYLIGHQMMEYMSPGVLRRVEKRMKREYDQEYLLTPPSKLVR
tara:strand:- start:244 stop:2862 length:2619 start_codon:yes stop_codon:yes gene_type:complete